MNEDINKIFRDFYNNPLFKKGFLDFFEKMQLEGIDAARKFWNTYPEKDVFPNAPELFEKLIDLYILMGVVPRAKYEDTVREYEDLKKNVQKVMKDLNLDVIAEGGEKAQDMWRDAINKQFEVNRELTKNYFELLKKIGSKG